MFLLLFKPEVTTIPLPLLISFLFSFFLLLLVVLMHNRMGEARPATGLEGHEDFFTGFPHGLQTIVVCGSSKEMQKLQLADFEKIMQMGGEVARVE